MNATTKHDFHPDAESLSAFAEQALSEREHDQVLKHLAACGRCRQVVALAQEAGLHAEVEVAAAGRAANQPYAWWRSWRFVWVPAAVAAAFAVASISVYMRHVEQSAEMAKNERERVTQAAATPPAAAPEAVKSPARSFKRTSEGTAPNPPSQELVVKAAMPAEPGGIEHPGASREEAAPPSAAAGPGFAGAGPAAERPTAAYTPEPAVEAWQQERQQKAAAGTEQRRLNAARARAPDSVHGGAAGGSSEQVTVSVDQLVPQAQQAARPAVPTPSGTLINPDGTTKRIYLPSGLRIESMAAAGHRTLAIDEAGTLFLSVDAGSHWKTVTQQWTGRAIVVRTETKNSASVAPAARAPANSSSDAGAAPSPASFFEILNDKNQTWLSTDGETWFAK
jgi:hypothetical protein